MKASLNWLENMRFSCDNHGLVSSMDASVDLGGGSAPTPKELILNAMMGCTAMDVVSMLKKMRQEIHQFKMEIEAEKTTEHPTHFKTAQLIYFLEGVIDEEKAIKAVTASMEKYCGVNFMISKTCEISYKVILNNKEIKIGFTNFT